MGIVKCKQVTANLVSVYFNGNRYDKTGTGNFYFCVF